MTPCSRERLTSAQKIVCGFQCFDQLTSFFLMGHPYLKAVAGVDHIGLGADYDGILHPARGMEDVSTYPMLSAELLHRGYTGEEIGKILGLNVIRVLEAVEEVSRGLKSTSLASNVHRSDVDSDVAPAAAAPE